MDDKAAFLRGINLFSNLEEDILNEIARKLRLQTLDVGQILCREDDIGNQMFFIESGSIEVLKRGEKDTDVRIAVLGVGDVTGELSLLGATRRTATLRVLAKGRIWVLDHDTFSRLLEENPRLATGLLLSLSRHLNRETSIVAKLLTRNVDKRFKIAFFDSKPYMEAAFALQNEACDEGFFIHFFEPRLTPETVSLATGFDAVCVFVNDVLDTTVIADLNELGIKLILLRCAGFNNVDLESCAKLDVTVARVPAYSPHAVAEHAIAMMMALNRRIHQAANRVREGNFSLNGLVGFDMHGKTAGIIGCGKIGECVIRILKGFGCRILVHTRTPKAQLSAEYGVEFVGLDELLKTSDVISLHAPLTPQTHHVINRKSIQKLKPGVMLINTSRGGLIDSSALVEGLKSGKIGFAGLDVYEEESDYFFEDFSSSIMTDDVLARLTTFHNVLITSHQAFLTREALGNIAETTLANAEEYKRGKRMGALLNSVNA